MLKRLLTFATDRIHNLPVIVLMPHSRCNCRCIMCDIWKANHQKKELSEELIQQHVVQFKKLGVREVVLSGGEALMHSNLWKLCAQLTAGKIKITLLSTGLLLEKHAADIIANCQAVIVSLDGSAAVHDSIRNIPDGFEKLTQGIKKLRQLKPGFKITARCVIQKRNFQDFINTVTSARKIGLDQISFLAADVSTQAFNHTTGIQTNEVALDGSETIELENILEQSFVDLRKEYAEGWIAESPEKMRKIINYYKALNGLAAFPETTCNAPWVSAVIESDGRVMPCFFHKPYGNIHDMDFLSIINSPSAIDFRKSLNVKTDPICQKCVCTLNVKVTQMI